MTPTERTSAALKADNIPWGKVERYIHFPKTDPRRKMRPGMRVDLFGIIDLIAIYKDGICGIQCCGADFAAHDRKILANDNTRLWLASGGLLELWSWRKVKKKRGGKQMVYRPRIKCYTIEDL